MQQASAPLSSSSGRCWQRVSSPPFTQRLPRHTCRRCTPSVARHAIKQRPLQTSTSLEVLQALSDDDWEEDDEDVDAADFDLPESSSFPTKRLPAEVRCFDTATIMVAGGTGGRGCVAFRREKFVPRGGPSGGNGGKGGDVYLVGDASQNSLLSFRRSVHFRAEHGEPGQGSDMHGQGGKDISVSVPPGTVVWARDAAAGDPPLGEVLAPGQRVLIARGGKGGRGNLAFKTARNTAPALAEHGERGQETWLRLEMQLVADAGIIGAPNAGKSTLLRVLSAARPKVADYPFTTLTPNLGVCGMDGRSTVFADVPGLVEGAHAGTGLGHEFLRHCRRCSVLVHVVDGSGPDPCADFLAVRRELELFDPGLAAKPFVLAYNKMDTPASSDYWPDVRAALCEEHGLADEDVLAVSAAAGTGVPALVRRVRRLLDVAGASGSWEEPGEVRPDRTGPRADGWGWNVAGAGAAGPAATPLRPGADATVEPEVVALAPPPAAVNTARLSDFSISSDLAGPRTWYVSGEALERFAQMTDWSYFEAAARFQGVLKAAGVEAALVRAGVRPGDTVVVGEVEFNYSEDQGKGALYGAWIEARKEAGVVGRGSARWPHTTG
ncbi:OBGE1 [Auxenochlorella protothecoides x Auxenochlorella symbiontica]